MVVGGAPNDVEAVVAARRVVQMALDMVELTRWVPVGSWCFHLVVVVVLMFTRGECRHNGAFQLS